jgi:hypothetical protein
MGNALNARIRLPVQRPVTRADCASVPRPCPFASECRYGLERDDNEGGRRYRGVRHARQMAEREAAGVTETCALDVADAGPLELERVAELMGVSKQAIQMIETRALGKMARRGWKLRGQCDE